MADMILKVSALSKAYNLHSSGSIIRNFGRRAFGKGGNDQPPEISWALKNIAFELRTGDRLAITGHNGAGKSTLLKILSKITAPTSGIIFGKGKITSMLEVGTGFHPELSGIENIYLNGAMLGLSKRDIEARLEEIICFAEIDSHIDTPVKRYSSGMYMRLAFSTAAHLQSDIMIMDEVLAVGDSDFRHKCINKLKALSDDFGKTIILVSHNKDHTNFLCNKEITLDNGRMI